MREGLVICENCFYLGHPKTIVKGSTGVELLLWISFIVPGIIYSTWRRNTRYEVCPKCESPSMVLAGSPSGKNLLTENKAWAPCGNCLEKEYVTSN